MRRDVQAVIVVVVFTMLAGSHLAAQDNGNLPTLSIAPFSGSKAQIPDWQPALGCCVSEILIEALEKPGGKFKVLQLADAPSTEAAPGKSDTSGASNSDFTFYGSVSELTIQTNTSHVGDFMSGSSFGNLGVKVVTAHVQLEWCIMDTGTRKVIKRGTAANFATGPALDMAAVAADNGKAATVQGAVVQNPVVQNAAAQNSTVQKAVTQTAAAQNTAAHNAAAPATTPATSVNGNSGAFHKPSVNDIFNGVGKAFGNPQGNASNGENLSGPARSGSATTAKSTLAPPNAGGEAGGSSGGTLGYEDPAFVNSAFGKATSKAVDNIVGQLAAVDLPESSRSANLKATTDALKHTPGKVIAVAGKDTIIVSLGSKQGFKEGDKLEVYQTTDVKDDKGNVVYSDEKLVGELTIISVQDDRCRTACADGLAVQQGWTVKAK